jgi:hypothetical protein
MLKKDSWLNRTINLKVWLIVVILSLLIIILGRYSLLVENYYATGFYPKFSYGWRLLLGWIPFSLGDILYLFLIIIIIVKIVQSVRRIFKRQWTRDFFASSLKGFLFGCLVIFVVFYISWGMNYSRKGIAYQLSLDVKPYTLQELDTLTGLLQKKLNELAAQVSMAERTELKSKKQLFKMGDEAYQAISVKYPFLKYEPVSLKPSIFSYAGNFLGFSGYYNPFTGEGQVNTTVPVFTRPFITFHEIAHQVGYAKENEANFMAYLSGREHPSVGGRYSIYFEMYRYSVYEIYKRDTALAAAYRQKLHPQVIRDLLELKIFSEKYESVAEDYFMGIFNLFLKANKQPAGTASYNQVVAWLEAYRKKFGNENL